MFDVAGRSHITIKNQKHLTCHSVQEGNLTAEVSQSITILQQVFVLIIENVSKLSLHKII